VVESTRKGEVKYSLLAASTYDVGESGGIALYT